MRLFLLFFIEPENTTKTGKKKNQNTRLPELIPPAQTHKKMGWGLPKGDERSPIQGKLSTNKNQKIPGWLLGLISFSPTNFWCGFFLTSLGSLWEFCGNFQFGKVFFLFSGLWGTLGVGTYFLRFCCTHYSKLFFPPGVPYTSFLPFFRFSWGFLVLWGNEKTHPQTLRPQRVKGKGYTTFLSFAPFCTHPQGTQNPSQNHGVFLSKTF